MIKVFNAFNYTSLTDVKVVIVGQDPYHGDGQANGLSFSVEEGIKIPPSLKNIYKELFYDLRLTAPENGNLESWARQGILLINSSLTVEKGVPGSHQGKGWEKFTDEVLSIINRKKKNIVFILWGKKAQEKGHFLDRDNHLVIESTHPSPFSAHNGFFGSKPFFQRPYRNNDVHVAIFGTNQLCEQTNFLPHRASSHITRLVAKFGHFDENPLVIFMKNRDFRGDSM